MSSDPNPAATGPTLPRLLAAATLILTVLLSGCGGGGTTLAGGGTSGTGITQGSVTGFGSVVVNGTRFETSGADISIRGNDATQGDLAVGMVVTVRGQWDSGSGEGTARSIVYDDAFRGAISSDPTADGRFRVLGQVVQVTASTVFDLDVSTETPFAALAQGDRVAVSGHFDADGVLRATRVERPAPADGVRLRGRVADGSLNTETDRFELDGGQSVDYTVVITTGPYTEEELENRLAQASVVVVEGPGVDMDDVLNAKALSFPRGTLDDDVDDAQLEGLITSGTDWGSFAVSGQPVITVPGETEFDPRDPGNRPFSIGLRVEVEGSVDADSQLVAEQVELRPEGDLELEDAVAGIFPEAPQFETRLGVRVRVTDGTVFDFDDDARLPSFDALRDRWHLAGADFVEVDGFWDAESQHFAATHVEVEDEDDGCSVEGPIQEIETDPRVVRLLGIDVGVLDSVTLTDFVVGDVVEAEPDGNGNLVEDCTDGMSNAELQAEDDDVDD